MSWAGLRDRNVVVTGAAGELGGAVVAWLLEAGASGYLPVRSASSASKLPGAASGRVQVTAGIDLEDDAAVSAYFAGLPSLWASIHCAGGFAMAPVTEISSTDWNRMMARNLTSAFLCSREAVRAIRRAGGGGRLVNVVSEQVLDPRRGAGRTAYTASKAGLAAFTVALAEEVAPEGILVNAVAPSILDTAANRSAIPGAPAAGWVTPAEAAAVIGWLASPANAVARGGVVPIFGGR